MRNAGLDEAQAGIKIARRNINNLRYADDTNLMEESKEELKSLLMKVKEESGKVGLKFNIQKTKIMASGPITSWEIDGETVKVKSLSPAQLFATPWTVAHQAPLSMGFPRHKYGIGCHFLLQEIFPNQGANPCLLCLLHWQAGSLQQSHLGSSR